MRKEGRHLGGGKKKLEVKAAMEGKVVCPSDPPA